ncbi:Chaperone ClpC1, chloroplastic -like protein [Gossypium arboreum]|uniref:Chaperone ClpC1, chloroplastic-like protein n=1 Tax=Gossypium arboreum TaxID=29729 RepID=A0A0B0MXT8_GOSAR|nr:Chaperone ClpC1, chloroplastic -like protein [Gossypium arboreum]
MNKGVEGSLVVTEADIQHIVSSWTGIPVEKVSTDEFDRLLKMEETLHKRVVGQDEAVKAINRAIRRARVGLKNPRPIASFIYSGPTGVGNSELAKNLQYLIDEKENNNTINNVCLLEHLDISDCHSLIWLSSTDISFPEEGFPTNLTSLKVSKEPRIYTSLIEWGFNRLTSLPELIISGEGCPNVVSFPEEGIVITLPPLTFIFIQKFENLEYMWFMGFQHLTSLQQLQIYTCPKLTSLPEKDMLLSLEHLLIYNCPLLEEGINGGIQYTLQHGIRELKLTLTQQSSLSCNLGFSLIEGQMVPLGIPLGDKALNGGHLKRAIPAYGHSNSTTSLVWFGFELR